MTTPQKATAGLPAQPIAEHEPSPSISNPVLAAALRYHELGIVVHPCVPGSKAPADRGWSQPRTQTREEVIETFKDWKGNIGGLTQGHVVIDVDVKVGTDGRKRTGDESLAKWTETHGALPPTLTIETPSGGLQLWYRLPDGFAAGTVIASEKDDAPFGRDVDVLGQNTQGGFANAVSAPSILANGQYKLIRDVPVANAPEHVLAAVKGVAGPRAIKQQTSWSWVSEDDPTRPERVALQREILTREARTPMASGRGAHRYVMMFQKLGPGLLLDPETTMENFAEIYDPALPGHDRWLPDCEADLVHTIERAYRLQMVDGAAPNQTWREYKILSRPTRTPTGHGPGSPVERRRHGEGHSYSFTLGEPSNQKLSRMTPAQATNHLVQLPEWEGVLQFDEFRQEVRAVDPPMRLDAEHIGGLSDADVVAIMHWFEVRAGYTISKANLFDAIIAAARRHTYHSVRDYLSALPPASGVLDTLAARALGNPDPLAQTLLKKVLVGAVRRVIKPATKMDYMLVLVGPQGKNKSSAIAALFGNEWFRADLSDIGKKDAQQDLLGYWAVEVAELEAIIRKDPQTVKSFVSREVDDFRLPYARLNQRFPRQCVLIGTTNDEDFLRDPTGNRRFWPLPVGDIDLEYLREHRDEIWAEAYALAGTDYPHWLEDESLVDAAREPFVQQDAWQDAISAWLIKNGQAAVTWHQVYAGAISAPGGMYSKQLADLGPKEQLRVTNSLKRLGCSPAHDRQGPSGKMERYWKVPVRLLPAAACQASPLVEQLLEAGAAGTHRAA